MILRLTTFELQLAPELRHPYFVIHTRDLPDLVCRGSCCLASRSTTSRPLRRHRVPIQHYHSTVSNGPTTATCHAPLSYPTCHVTGPNDDAVVASFGL